MKALNNLGRILRSKVVCDTPRAPVNKQAALIVRPANWICKPIPEADRSTTELEAEITELKNDLEAAAHRERALNALLAKLRAKLDAVEVENLSLRRELDRILKLL